MKKFFLFVFAAFTSAFLLFQQSDKPDHSLIYKRSDGSLYDLVKRDDSFILPIAFCFINNRARTGEYEIKYGDTVLSVIQRILAGENVIRKFTIPEGYTSKLIVEKLNSNNLLLTDITEIPPEASIMPNTYLYKFGTSKLTILKQMAKEMDNVIRKIEKSNKTSLSTNEILVLASIIEKETGNLSEMATISSVYHNRLKIKMRLQSDPTVVYAVSNGYGKMDRPLNKSDLFFKSPYNTYRNAGLPPAPICCPGWNAIYAAMFPADTKFLYFVANKDKTGHVFAKTFQEHIKNKKQNR